MFSDLQYVETDWCPNSQAKPFHDKQKILRDFLIVCAIVPSLLFILCFLRCVLIG